MKISDGFDARRLRPKAHRDWGSRLVLIFAALLILCGVLLLRYFILYAGQMTVA